MFALEHLIDIAYLIIGIVVICIFGKRGFVKSFFKYGRGFLSGYAAYKLGPVVGKYIFDKFIFNGVCQWVSSKIETALRALTGKIDVDKMIDSTPFIVRQFVDSETLKQELAAKLENTEATVLDIAPAIAEPFSNVVSNLIAYVLVFLVALLVLTLIGKLFELIAKLPILRGVNTILGIFFGIASAFILLSAITYILSILIGIFGNILYLEELSKSSYLFGFFDWIHLFNLF